MKCHYFASTVIAFVVLFVAWYFRDVQRRSIMKSSLDVAGMRFFRDLSRIKARRRLWAPERHGLVLYSDMFLLGREEVITSELHENGVTISVEELAGFNGFIDKDAPLWLAVKGRVYDVTEGKRFYGPGMRYNVFTGRDATRALCTGCMEPECLITSTDGLSDNQIREADRWVDFFEFHDRYTYVGRLIADSDLDVDAMVEMALEMESGDDYSPPVIPV